MPETYKEQIDRLKSKDVVSAQKFIDYLHNDMLTHLETVLAKHIKKWDRRGFHPIYENPVRILIDRSAKTYKERPKRNIYTQAGEFSQQLTDRYEELLEKTDINFIMQDVDSRARGLNTALVMPNYDKDTDSLLMSVLSRNNCDVIINTITRQIDSLVYTAFSTGKEGGQMFHFWTPDRIIDLEDTEGGLKVRGNMANPYGFVPAPMLHDSRPPLGRLWKYPGWEQLIQFSDGLNLFNTETLFNARYASVGSPITNLELPDGFVLGIDAPLSANTNDGSDPFFEFRTPTVNLEGIMGWLNKFKEAIADEWGVNLKFAGGSIADSGFKLVVEEFENIELRQKRIVAAKVFERDLYKTLAGMSEIENFGLDKTARCFADFKEPALPVNNTEEWTITKEKLATGYTSLEREWLKDDPDLTPEDIAQRKREIQAGMGMAGNTPSFEGI